MFYEYCYEYINYKSDVELFSGDMERYLKKTESAEFYFNPMIYKICQDKFTTRNGEFTGDEFVEAFLNADRWGHKS